MKVTVWMARLVLSGSLVSAATASAEVETSDTAQRLRELLEIRPGETLFSSDETEELQLEIGEVFNQTGTQWCWAYSAFHASRTYYLHTEDDNPAVPEWREALEKINTSDEFRAYMRRWRSPGQTGHPRQFFTRLQTVDGLPAQPWTVYSYTGLDVLDKRYGGEEFTLTLPVQTHVAPRNVANRIYSNLKRGVPSVWCGVGHCVTIYGGAYVDGQAQEYDVADSSGGRTYRSSARRMHQNMDIIMTLAE